MRLQKILLIILIYLMVASLANTANVGYVVVKNYDNSSSSTVLFGNPINSTPSKDPRYVRYPRALVFLHPIFWAPVSLLAKQQFPAVTLEATRDQKNVPLPIIHFIEVSSAQPTWYETSYVLNPPTPIEDFKARYTPILMFLYWLIITFFIMLISSLIIKTYRRTKR